MWVCVWVCVHVSMWMDWKLILLDCDWYTRGITLRLWWNVFWNEYWMIDAQDAKPAKGRLRRFEMKRTSCWCPCCKIVFTKIVAYVKSHVWNWLKMWWMKMVERYWLLWLSVVIKQVFKLMEWCDLNELIEWFMNKWMKMR